MTKSEGIGHPLKIETIEDFGPSFCSRRFMELGNSAGSIAVLRSSPQLSLADRQLHQCA